MKILAFIKDVLRSETRFERYLVKFVLALLLFQSGLISGQLYRYYDRYGELPSLQQFYEVGKQLLIQQGVL
jgi:hypothetical protein